MPSVKNCFPSIVNAARGPGCKRCAVPCQGFSGISSIRRRGLPLLFTLAILISAHGCATTELYQFRTHADKGDHAWIAARPVRCDHPSPTCGELHLISGAACFELALAEKAPAGHLACAADALEKGLALYPSAPDAVHYRQLLCESLRKQLLAMPSPADKKTRNRLTDAARALYRAAPDSTAARYYLASARYQDLNAHAAVMTAATRHMLCSRLKRTMGNVLSAIRSAELTPSPEWAAYAARYHRLAFDLGVTLRQAQCR